MNPETLKQAAAQAALERVSDEPVIGVGSGTTVDYFIAALKSIKHKIDVTVASSKATEEKLKALGIPVADLNAVGSVSVYVDGADEVNHSLQCIKGGGGALTREKIIAAASKKFICIAHETKYVDMLGTFPLPIEVIPMARSYVAREILKLNGDPVYRQGFITDNGNVILDVHNLKIFEPMKLEATLNNIVGVVTNGLFAKRPADILLLASMQGIKEFTVS